MNLLFITFVAVDRRIIMDKIVEDDELGRLIVRVNSRARSLVFRTKSDAVYVSVPPGTTLKEVKQAIENLRGKLRPPVKN